MWGYQTLRETLRSTKDLGEVWSFMGKVLGTGAGVRDAGRDVNTEGPRREDAPQDSVLS